MKSNFLKKSLTSLLILGFWIGVWYLAALLVDSILLLPTPHDTLLALIGLLATAEFYKVVLFTLLRVAAGLLLGVAAGVLLALLRVALGIHFVRDVVAGALIGAASGGIGLAVLHLI